MIRKPAAKVSWLTLALLAAALALWLADQARVPETKPPPPQSREADASRSTGDYETHHGCSLAEDRNNDGDSFLVRMPDGRKAVFRLYFVDAPESAFKRYAAGQTNHARIRQQAADLGGITPEQAVEAGRQAKALTLGLLGNAPFSVFTRWDSPFHDRRYHAFVRVEQGGKPRWLHEILVERGLARIKTKGAELPDGTPAASQLEKLRQLERAARHAGTGVWGR